MVLRSLKGLSGLDMVDTFMVWKWIRCLINFLW